MGFIKFLIGYLMTAVFYNAAAMYIIYPLIAFLCAITGLVAMTGILQIIAVVAFVFYTIGFIAKAIDILIAVITRTFAGPFSA